MIKIRPYEERDIPFICNTWFRQAWRAVSKSKPNFDTFADAQRAAMAFTLNRAITSVAYLESVPDEILGYSISEPTNNVLHFIYVKKDYRRQGIGAKLLPPTPAAITKLTFRPNTDGRHFLRRYLPNADFDRHYIPGLMARAAYLAHRLDATDAASRSSSPIIRP